MAHLLVYGGTFDPVHYGHLIPCRHAREVLGAERVVLMPARVSPHKAEAAPTTSSDDRVAMLRLAVEGEAGFAIDSRELGRAGPSYTYDTLEAMTREAAGAGGGDRVTLLIGADQLPKFATWHRVKELLGLVEVAVLRRPGADAAAGLAVVRGQVGSAAARVRLLETPLIEISATAIRARVAEGRSIRFLVPPAVEAYIHGRRLYGAAAVR